MKNKNERLKIELNDDKVVISFGINTLKYVAEKGCEPQKVLKYDKSFNADGCWKKVIDATEFAKDVIYELTREEEDGTTKVHLLIEEAIRNAIENGSCGVDSYPKE